MKLPLFKKNDEQGEIDRMIQENIEKSKVGEEEKVETRQTPVAADKDSTLTKIMMDVDKLKAHIEALNQIRQISEQRSQRISEELGDLRRSGMEMEKDITQLRLEATKAFDLVSSVQPEKFMMNLEKDRLKIEELTAMHEANKKLIDYITEEIKKIRTDITAFRGAESMIKLNEEVREELSAIKKVELTVEKHADKVETIFINMQRKFNEFTKLSDEFKLIQNSLNGVMKDVDSFRTDFKSLATKDDLSKLENFVADRLLFVENMKRDMGKKCQEMNDLITQANTACSGVKEIEGALKGRIANVDKSISKLEMMEKQGYVTADKFDTELDEFFKNILEKIEEHNKEVEGKILSLQTAGEIRTNRVPDSPTER